MNRLEPKLRPRPSVSVDRGSEGPDSRRDSRISVLITRGRNEVIWTTSVLRQEDGATVVLAYGMLVLTSTAPVPLLVVLLVLCTAPVPYTILTFYFYLALFCCALSCCVLSCTVLCILL